VRSGVTMRQSLVSVANELIVLLQLVVSFYTHLTTEKQRTEFKGLAVVILVMWSPWDVQRVSVAEVEVQVIPVIYRELGVVDHRIFPENYFMISTECRVRDLFPARSLISLCSCIRTRCIYYPDNNNTCISA